jgi:glycosyltransferase involved in cell wall biosynthesis
MQSQLSITAIVLTLNEQSHIVECLRSLSFCNQILVVDSGSRDATCQLARQNGAEVLELQWEGFAAQRNKALAHASNDWILSIDADERVTPELEAELEQLFTSRVERASAYTMPRKTIHFGRWIRHGGWYPNRLVRLFRKSQGSWEGGELHEKWETSGKVGALGGDILHFSFSDFSDQVERNNLYSTLGAQKLMRQGRKFTFAKLVAKTLSKFIETYFLKRGFLDGYPGLFISVSAAYSVFLKWAKLWELERVPVESSKQEVPQQLPKKI